MKYINILILILFYINIIFFNINIINILFIFIHINLILNEMKWIDIIIRWCELICIELNCILQMQRGKKRRVYRRTARRTLWRDCSRAVPTTWRWRRRRVPVEDPLQTPSASSPTANLRVPLRLISALSLPHPLPSDSSGPASTGATGTATSSATISDSEKTRK